MNYVKFCAAVEPKHGGRDLDNQARELDKAWREKHPPVGVGRDIANSGGVVGMWRRKSAEVERVATNRGMDNTKEVGVPSF